MNSDDHGFGVFVIDDKSIRFFEQNLHIIESQLNKAVVIGQLLIMMREILYPATRLPLILN
jgi:predicted glutamine amidotransferase